MSARVCLKLELLTSNSAGSSNFEKFRRTDHVSDLYRYNRTERHFDSAAGLTNHAFRCGVYSEISKEKKRKPYSYSPLNVDDRVIDGLIYESKNLCLQITYFEASKLFLAYVHNIIVRINWVRELKKKVNTISSCEEFYGQIMSENKTLQRGSKDSHEMWWIWGYIDDVFWSRKSYSVSNLGKKSFSVKIWVLTILETYLFIFCILKKKDIFFLDVKFEYRS